MSYLPRLIKMFRAVFERSANMPKHPLINYPRLYPLLHMTTKNHICVLFLSHIQSFVLMPLVLSSPATVTVYRIQRHFSKNPLFRTPRTSKREYSLKSKHRFFHDDNTFPIGKVNFDARNRVTTQCQAMGQRYIVMTRRK